MDTFEELGLSPELMEALSSEGMEEPTPFQAAAIPVIRRGNNLVGRAGPGGGTLIAYSAALLDRLEPGAGTPRALVVATSTDAARRLAECLAGLAAASGHTVASAGSPWVLPERADILFGTAAELLAWAQASRFDVNAVEALVLDQAGAIQRMGGLGAVEALLAFLPKEGQRIVLALPASPEIDDFVERHVRRAIQVPPRAVEAGPAGGPQRGEVRYRIVEEPREDGALQLVAELLEEARHCCLFFATEDSAADVGDYLTLHGFTAAAPGEESAPVWLAVDELAARTAVQAEGVVAVSFDAPTGPDSLDRRHGGGKGGVIVVLPREMPHLRDVARSTGYKVVPFPPPAPTSGRAELDGLLASLEAATAESDLAPWLIALEPLFARKGAAEIAAAAVALLRQRAPAAPAKEGSLPTLVKHETTRAAAPGSAPKAERAAPVSSGASVKLYVSLGERDNAGPGDIMGAITGESGIPGSQIGRIEVRDTFSIVEVPEAAAEKVIRSLNGVTVRGRSVRVDYDRPRPSGGRDARGPQIERSDSRPPREDRGESRGGPRGERSAGRPAPRGANEGRPAPRGDRKDSRGGPRGPRSEDRAAPRGGSSRPTGGERGGAERGGQRDRKDGPKSGRPAPTGRSGPPKSGPAKGGPPWGGPSRGGPAKRGPAKGGPPPKGGRDDRGGSGPPRRSSPSRDSQPRGGRPKRD
ncbi:MAG: DEAD/DEAH box helicase [Gemmatimonadetes bacterium]|nr:DEAD/DEAH box helicase [Gemmatimonadota bacterium]